VKFIFLINESLIVKEIKKLASLSENPANLNFVLMSELSTGKTSNFGN